MITENDVKTRIQIDKMTKCAHWTGSVDKHKPVLYKDGRKYAVRSEVYKMRKGPVLQGFYVEMTCGNWDCVQSKHMELRPKGRRFGPRLSLDTGKS